MDSLWPTILRDDLDHLYSLEEDADEVTETQQYIDAHFEKAGVPLSTQEPAASYKIVAWNDVGRRKNDRTVRIRRNDVYESPE